MAKIIIFLEKGKATEAAIKRKVELSVKGDTVVMSNGSFDKGFEDSCDKVIMCCENKRIEDWAKRNFIEVEYLDTKKVLVPNPVEGNTEEVVVNVNKNEISMLDAAKDKVKTPEDSIPKSMPVGVYEDPDGNRFDHKGRAYRNEFKDAIMKHGIENFKLIEAEE